MYYKCNCIFISASSVPVAGSSKYSSKSKSCDECDYVTNYAANLKRHKEIKHKDVRYPCDQCEYAATALGSLKRHKKSKHGPLLVTVQPGN